MRTFVINSFVVVLSISCASVFSDSGRASRVPELLTSGPAGTVVAPLATDPFGLMRRFEWAYENRELSTYAALFTADFRFHFSDPELARKYPFGWSREDEVLAARHLFEGFVNDEGDTLPRAVSIKLTLGPLVVARRPARSNWEYEKVVIDARTVRLWIRTEDGGYMVNESHHQFWLVRDDVAHISPGQEESSNRWYIQKWVENPAMLAAAQQEEEPRETALDVYDSSFERLEFALKPVTPNPTTRPFQLSFVLTTREVAFLQMYDVRGRLLDTRSVGHLDPGRHTVQFRGLGLRSGVYWLRLRQGQNLAKRKLIIL